MSDLDLAKLWCRVNRSECTDSLMDWIESNIGLKACLREWNIDMSDEAFELWWSKRKP